MGPAAGVICVYVHALVATGVVRNARLIAADLAAHPGLAEHRRGDPGATHIDRRPQRLLETAQDVELRHPPLRQ